MNSLRATLAKEVGPYSQRKSSLLHQSWVVQAGGVVQKRALSDDTESVAPGIWLEQRAPDDPEWVDLPAEEREEWMAKALVVPLLAQRHGRKHIAELAPFDALAESGALQSLKIFFDLLDLQRADDLDALLDLLRLRTFAREHDQSLEQRGVELL